MAGLESGHYSGVILRSRCSGLYHDVQSQRTFYVELRETPS